MSLTYRDVESVISQTREICNSLLDSQTEGAMPDSIVGMRTQIAAALIIQNGLIGVGSSVSDIGPAIKNSTMLLRS